MIEKRIPFMGITIDDLTLDEIVVNVFEMVDHRKPVQIVGVNVDQYLLVKRHEYSRKIFAEASLVFVDGKPIMYMSKLLGHPLKQRTTGPDLMENICKRGAERKYKIFLLGSKETIIKALVKKIRNKYGEDIIVGYRNGYFNKDEEQNIIHKINSSGAHMLFIGIGSPYKEEFISRNLNEINVPFIMGVGGSFDVLSGHIKRAPLWMQKHGLDWFYRFLKEPKRMFRKAFIINLKFIYMVFEEKLKINKR